MCGLGDTPFMAYIYIYTATCFDTEAPSSGSDYNKGT